MQLQRVPSKKKKETTTSKYSQFKINMFFYLSWQIYRSSGLWNKNMGRINKTNQLTQCGKVRPVDWRETEGLVRNMLQYTVTCTGSCDRFKLMSNQTPKWLDVSICWFCSREVGRLLKLPSYEIFPAGYCIQGYIWPRFIFTLFPLLSAGKFKAG